MEQLKARLLFQGVAFVIGMIAFAIGYRIPKSLHALPIKVERTSDVATVLTESTPLARSSRDLQHDHLRVEGFAQIGFAEMADLLTTASPSQREQWARELGALPNKPLKPIALTAFYTAWLDLDPEAAFRSLRAFPDLLYREQVVSSIGVAAPPALLSQLIGLISELSAVEQHGLLPGFLSELDQTDPVASARFIDSHPNLVSASDAAALMSAWARDDIDAARKWLEASPFAAESDVLRSLVDSWFTKDPAAAQSYVILHRDSESFEEAANSVASHLFGTSPEQARQFIRAFDDQHASYILFSLVSSADNSQIANLVTWVATFPTSSAQHVLGDALVRWSSLDPRKAVDWLRTKPEAERDSLVVQMIHSEMARPSPELVALAYNIHDVQERDKALSILVRSLAVDSGDATEQIRGLGLSTSQTNHLLELGSDLGNDVPATHNN